MISGMTTLIYTGVPLTVWVLIVSQERLVTRANMYRHNLILIPQLFSADTGKPIL